MILLLAIELVFALLIIKNIFGAIFMSFVMFFRSFSRMFGFMSGIFHFFLQNVHEKR